MNASYQHGQLPEIDRRKDLRRAALDAEWQGATGKYAGVIRQLRFRGNQFSMRASWIYRGLLAVIIIGLMFYLGLPYWEKYVDGKRQTLRSQQLAHATEHAKLDNQRSALVHGSEGQKGLLELLATTATPIPSGVEGWLWEAIVEGQNILLFGGDGAITRSTDGGQTFTPVPSGVVAGLQEAIVEGQNILLFGGDGAITRSTDGGQTFTPVPSGVEVDPTGGLS